MTFKAAKLLRRLKKAQMYQDEHLVINFDEMTAKTIRSQGGDFQEVSLRGFETSLFSTLDYLESKDYISYAYPSGEAVVSHTGWHATEATVRDAVRFTVKDVIIPIIVAVIASIITTAVLN